MGDGLGSWLSDELAGRVWEVGEGCGVRIFRWKGSVKWEGKMWVFGWFLGVLEALELGGFSM